jgi:hypothetical protein
MKPPKEKPMHFHDACAPRGAGGVLPAPCGAVVLAPIGAGPEERSTTDLAHVTCAECQDRIASIGKAYSKARRSRVIAW